MRGPSLSIDAEDASSLVAMHQAAEATLEVVFAARFHKSRFP